MEDYIKKLDYKISKKEFNNIKDKILSDKTFDYTKLILPGTNKSLWENCAKILVCLEDDIFIQLLPNILEWFKDLNWPGAMIILERFEKYPSNVIEKEFIKTLEKANEEKDNTWIEFLLWPKNIKTENIINKVTDIFEDIKTYEIFEWLSELPEEQKNQRVTDILKKLYN